MFNIITMKEMQIQNTVRYPYTPTSTSKIKSYNMLPRMQKIWIYHALPVEMTLFVRDKNWKPKCPSIGEKVEKLSYSHTMKYYNTT